MSAIKRHMEAIWDLHWRGKTRKEIIEELGTTEDLVDGAMEILKEMQEDDLQMDC